MKNVLKIALVFVALIAMTYQAEAVENWVVCKHPVTGHVQSFPGMSCPFGWHPL